ncbi:MAG: acyltransferase [Mesorhizobium sp.]
MKRLYAIQYLRAVAALGVVVFHAAERTGTHFAIGAAGVDIFFVISGFIMWVLAGTRTTTPAAFLRERIKRIVPLYWIVTGVMILGALFGLFPNLRLTPGYVLSSLFFIPSRSPGAGDIWPVLVQGWTLNYEMFFYLLFAASLFLRSRWRPPALTMLFLALVATGLLTDPQMSAPRIWTDPLLLEFLLGMALGEIWLRGVIPPSAWGGALAAFAVAGFAFVGITYRGFMPFVLGPLAAALVLGVLAFEKKEKVARVPLAAYFGDASYSIYLWHTLAISVVAKAGPMLALPPFLTFVAAVLCGTAIGVAVHEILEKPIAAFMKAHRQRLKAPAPSSQPRSAPGACGTARP